MDLLGKSKHGYMDFETWKAFREMANWLCGIYEPEIKWCDFLTEGEGEISEEYQWDIMKWYEEVI